MTDHATMGDPVWGPGSVGPDNPVLNNRSVTRPVHPPPSTPEAGTAPSEALPPLNAPLVEWRRNYPATLVDVHDGDTIHVLLDLGVGITVTKIIRLYGINAPELITDEGKLARTALVDMLVGDLVVQTVEDRVEKFGRLLGVLFIGTVNVNDEMVSTGHALPYDGHGPKPV